MSKDTDLCTVAVRTVRCWGSDLQSLEDATEPRRATWVCLSAFLQTAA